MMNKSLFLNRPIAAIVCAVFSTVSLLGWGPAMPEVHADPAQSYLSPRQFFSADVDGAARSEQVAGYLAMATRAFEDPDALTPSMKLALVRGLTAQVPAIMALREVLAEQDHAVLRAGLSGLVPRLVDAPLDFSQQRPVSGDGLQETESAAKKLMTVFTWQDLELDPAGEHSHTDIVKAFLHVVHRASNGAREISPELLSTADPYRTGPFSRQEIVGSSIEHTYVVNAWLPTLEHVLDGVAQQLNTSKTSISITLNANITAADLGFNWLREFLALLWHAKDETGELIIGSYDEADSYRWIYKGIPAVLVPRLTERHIRERYAADIAAALANPFRIPNAEGNHAVVSMISKLLDEHDETFVHDPLELQKNPEFIVPWVKLMLATNLVDYSHPAIIQAIQRKDSLAEYILAQMNAPFLHQLGGARYLRQFIDEVVTDRPFLKLVQLPDNNAQIGASLKLAEVLLAANPNLTITIVPKADNRSMNDASVEDVEKLLEMMPALRAYRDQGRFYVVAGPSSAGTPLNLLSREAMEVLEEADIVLSEGEANSYSLNGLNKIIYFGFRMKWPEYGRYVIGVELETKHPPVFYRVDGTRGLHYRNALNAAGAGERLTVLQTLAAQQQGDGLEATARAAGILRELLTSSELGFDPAAESSDERIVRAFLNVLRRPPNEAGEMPATSFSVSPYRSGIYTRRDVAGHEEERLTEEGWLGTLRRVLSAAALQTDVGKGLSAEDLGLETLQALFSSLWNAQDAEGRFLVESDATMDIYRWLYRDIPRKLALRLTPRDVGGKLSRTLADALDNPFRLANEKGNAAMEEEVRHLLDSQRKRFTDHPQELQRDPERVIPWIELMIASNLVDYSIASLAGRMEEASIRDLIRAQIETPFLSSLGGKAHLAEFVNRFVREEPEAHLVQIPDNNAQIVASLKLAEALLSANPNLRITLIPKGDNGVMNDASWEDVERLLNTSPLYARLRQYRDEGRFQNVAGPSAVGTPLDLLPPEALRALIAADVVLSEGEANLFNLNGLAKEIYFGLVLKLAVSNRYLFGFEPDAFGETHPPAFFRIDGSRGAYYSNPLDAPGAGERRTILSTLALQGDGITLDHQRIKMMVIKEAGREWAMIRKRVPELLGHKNLRTDIRWPETFPVAKRTNTLEGALITLATTMHQHEVSAHDPESLDRYLLKHFGVRTIIIGAGRSRRYSEDPFEPKVFARLDGENTVLKHALQAARINAPDVQSRVKDVVVLSYNSLYHLLSERSISSSERNQLVDVVNQNFEQIANAVSLHPSMFSDVQETVQQALRDGLRSTATGRRGDLRRTFLQLSIRLQEMERDLGGERNRQALVDEVGYVLFEALLQAPHAIDEHKQTELVGNNVIIVLSPIRGPGWAYYEALKTLEQKHLLAQTRYTMPVYADYSTAFLDSFPHTYLVGYLSLLDQMSWRYGAQPRFSAETFLQDAALTQLPLAMMGTKSPLDHKGVKGRGQVLMEHSSFGPIIRQSIEWASLTETWRRHRKRLEMASRAAVPAEAARPGEYHHFNNAGVLIFDGRWALDRYQDTILTDPHYAHATIGGNLMEYAYLDLVELAYMDTQIRWVNEPEDIPLVKAVHFGENSPSGVGDRASISQNRQDYQSMLHRLLRELGVQVDSDAEISIYSPRGDLRLERDLPLIFPHTGVSLSGRVQIEAGTVIGEGVTSLHDVHLKAGTAADSELVRAAVKPEEVTEGDGIRADASALGNTAGDTRTSGPLSKAVVEALQTWVDEETTSFSSGDGLVGQTILRSTISHDPHESLLLLSVQAALQNKPLRLIVDADAYYWLNRQGGVLERFSEYIDAQKAESVDLEHFLELVVVASEEETAAIHSGGVVLDVIDSTSLMRPNGTMNLDILDRALQKRHGMALERFDEMLLSQRVIDQDELGRVAGHLALTLLDIHSGIAAPVSRASTLAQHLANLTALDWGA